MMNPQEFLDHGISLSGSVVQNTLIAACPFCNSSNVLFSQDVHNKSIDGNPCGLLKCNNCKNLAFWILKFKTNCTIQNEQLELKVVPKLKLMPQWDGPITQWLYTNIEENSKLVRRPIESYWTVKIK